MKVVFAGTPEIAVPALKAIAQVHNLVAVLTNPPAETGRGRKVCCSPVETEAVKTADPGVSPVILSPEKITDETIDSLKNLNPDILVCFAYGKIFPKKLLDIFPKGGINFHPSLLPLFRGCAPIPFAIISGETETGFTVQTLGEKMDSGCIILQEKIPLPDNITAGELEKQASLAAPEMLLKALALIEEGKANPVQQEESRATYCKKIKKEDCLIDWNKDAREISCKIRGLSPKPGCYTFYEAPKSGESILYILNCSAIQDAKLEEDSKGLEIGTVVGYDKKRGIFVKCGKDFAALTILQKPTKKPLDWKSFINGERDFIHKVLGKKPETKNDI